MRWHLRLLRRARTERQLDAELRFHLEQQIADYIASGISPEEARRRVRLEFGGLDQVKEACRDVGVARFVEALIQDLRYGLRQLRRNLDSRRWRSSRWGSASVRTRQFLA